MPLDTTITEKRRTVSLAEVIDQLARFEGPPEQFLAAMLHAQCRIAPAEAGAILRQAADKRVDLIGAYPQIEPGGTTPVWLARAAELTPAALNENQTVAQPFQTTDGMYDEQPSKHIVLLPVRSGAVRAVSAFFVDAPQPPALARARERLELTSSLLSLYEARKALGRRNEDLERLTQSMEVLSSLNEHSRMKAAAFALCNEIASRYQADRVSLGFLKGRYVKLVAMSHTEKFTRKMKLVQDIESAMEECLDQDIEAVHPAAEGASFVSRAAKDLSDRHGPTTVVSLPLRRDGKVVAVLTVERAIDKRYTVDEVEMLRLTCDLMTARLAELHENDRWVGAKLAASTRRGLGYVIGTEHTWIKLIVLAALAFLCFAIFVKGPDRVDATFVLEPARKQVITAPYSGHIADVFVEPGQRVIANETVLARLDTVELQDKLAVALAELATYQKEADQARRDNKQGEVQIALAKVDRINAQINLLRHQISRSEIRAKIDGVVMPGERKDLRELIGARVEPTTPLFEIAPVDELHAELAIPEDRIADVAVGSTGELASTARAGEYLAFEIERINPVAEVVEQKNVFKAKARIDPGDSDDARRVFEQLKARTTGVAKIDAGEAPYGYLWTRDLINWIRMKLWF